MRKQLKFKIYMHLKLLKEQKCHIKIKTNKFIFREIDNINLPVTGKTAKQNNE